MGKSHTYKFAITVIIIFYGSSFCFGKATRTNPTDAVDSSLQQLFEKEKALEKTNNDSALYFAHLLVDLLKNDTNDSIKIKAYIAFANVNSNLGNYKISTQYYLQSLELVDSRLNDSTDKNFMVYKFLEMQLFSNLGINHFQMADYDISLNYFKQAKDDYIFLEKKNYKPLDNRFKVSYLINIGSVYGEKKDYTSALENFLLALNIIQDKTSISPELLNNIGNCFLNLNQMEKSLSYFDEALSIAKLKNDKAGSILVYNNLAEHYRINHKFDKAEYYLKQASDLESTVNIPYYRMYNYLYRANLYKDKNEYKKAFENYTAMIKLRDSLNDVNESVKISLIEQEYAFEREKEKLLLDKVQRESRQKIRNLTYLISISAISIFCLVILMLYTLQKNKIRRVEILNQKIEIANEKLENDVQIKNKELATNVLYLLRKNELIGEIAEKLLYLKSNLSLQNQQPIQKVIEELEQNKNDDAWQEFELRFKEVHDSFYKALNEKFPDLSTNEKRLCAFLRLNMSTKEISSITFQSQHSINIARARLRKKLGIDNSDTTLHEFLFSFG